MYLLLLNFYKLKGTKLDSTKLDSTKLYSTKPYSTKPSPKELSIFRDELIKDAREVDLLDIYENMGTDSKKAAFGEYYKQFRKKIKKVLIIQKIKNKMKKN